MHELEITSEITIDALKKTVRFLQVCQEHYGVTTKKNQGIKLFFQDTEHKLIGIDKEFVVSLSNSHTILKRSD